MVSIAPEELHFLKFAACARILDPSCHINIDDEFVRKSVDKTSIDWHNSPEDWLKIGAYLKMFRPGLPIAFTSKQIERIRAATQERKQEGAFELFARYTALMRIVGISVQLGPKDWADMHAAVREQLKENAKRMPALGGPASEPVLEMLANMRILAAESVKVTEHGLELTMPKKIDTSAVPPVPENSQL